MTEEKGGGTWVSMHVLANIITSTFYFVSYVTDLGVHIPLHEHAPMNAVCTILVDELRAVWMPCGLSKIHRISVTTMNTKKNTWV